MQTYKVLRLRSQRNAPLECIVDSGMQSWSSIDEALTELGKSGWRVDTPIYGPVPGRSHEGEQWLEALILVKDDHSVTEQSCGNCIFWFYKPPTGLRVPHELSESDRGECRFDSPRVHPGQEYHISKVPLDGSWPATYNV